MSIAVCIACILMELASTILLIMTVSYRGKASPISLLSIPVAIGFVIWLTLLIRVGTVSSLMWTIGREITLLITEALVLVISVAVFVLFRKLPLQVDCWQWRHPTWAILLITSAILLVTYVLARRFMYKAYTIHYTSRLSVILLLTAAVGWLSAAVYQSWIVRRSENRALEETMAYLHEQQHDYRKQLFLLRESPDPRTLEQFIREEYKTDGLIKLERSVLMVLVPYLKQLEEKQLDYEINITEVVPCYNIPYKDMIRILGNLLENAIAATLRFRETVPDLNRKALFVQNQEAKIIIEFASYHSDNRIQIRNPVISNPIVQKSGVQQHDAIDSANIKPEQAHFKHRYGLVLVRSALRPYFGRLYTDKSNGTFTAEVVVPIPQEEPKE